MSVHEAGLARLAMVSLTAVVAVAACGGGDPPVLLAKSMAMERAVDGTPDNLTYARVTALQASNDELQALSAAGVGVFSAQCKAIAPPAALLGGGSVGWPEVGLLIEIDPSSVEKAKAAGYQVVNESNLWRFGEEGRKPCKDITA